VSLCSGPDGAREREEACTEDVVEQLAVVVPRLEASVERRLLSLGVDVTEVEFCRGDQNVRISKKK
jgi:hypothetical protein